MSQRILPREQADEHLAGTSVAQLVVDEIDRPDVVRIFRPQPDDRGIVVIQTLYDPYPVRSAEISNVMTPIEMSGWKFVCVKANAKNRMGGYTGRKTASVRIKNNQIVGSMDNAPACLDSRLKYHQFPELENIR